jgi:hypothetical protein
MEGKPIAHTFTFKYLGFYFDADNDQSNHINQRMGQASDRFRSLMHIWTSNKLPITLKRRIYCSAVISVLTYGHLVLLFDDKVQKRLNGFNARCLATIYIGHRIVLPAVRIQRIKEHSVPLAAAVTTVVILSQFCVVARNKSTHTHTHTQPAEARPAARPQDPARHSTRSTQHTHSHAPCSHTHEPNRSQITCQHGSSDQ